MVPERFVDSFGEVALKHGMIRIELLSQSGPEPAVTERLLMSVQTFMQMLQVQQALVEKLAQAGALRPITPPTTLEPPAMEPPAPMAPKNDASATNQFRPRPPSGPSPVISPNFRDK
jgi:hypothetical protein